LFPSTYEGFGLPVIEGFKSGRPVIASNIAPMNDISAGAALLVDPNSIASIREGVISVMTDEKLRAEMVAKGFEVITNYDSQKIASSYLALWNNIVSDNR
jgi:glycosyltransferase involved in cell wall biosynthesis